MALERARGVRCASHMAELGNDFGIKGEPSRWRHHYEMMTH
jgi:hypothetical protein